MDPDLFRRLGGRDAMRRIVDGLYDRLEKDRDLKRLFGSRRAGERARQKLFFEELFGGEPLHSTAGHADVGMQRRHVHRAITRAEAERWLAHFDASMAACGVETGTRADTLAALRGAAFRLTNEGAPYQTVLKAIALASKGRIAPIEALIADYPAIVNQRGRDGVTMLWEASRRGHLPLVTWLVEHGAEVDIPGSDAHATEVVISPYCAALRAGRSEVADYLLAHGAAVDAYTAAYLGDTVGLEGLLAAAPALVDAATEADEFYPVTPLHYAVDGRNLDAARLLIERGTEVRRYSRRLLTSAASAGSLELVRLLLDQGADATVAENLGPLAVGDASIARELIARGLNIDKPVRGRETFLTRACRGDKGEHPLTVQTLLDLGADPNLPNGFGRTGLHAAAKGGFVSVVQVLLAHGADVDAVDAGGATPIDLALASGRTEAAALLRAAGAAGAAGRSLTTSGRSAPAT